MRKPAELHDRDQEWADLVRFTDDPSVGATLGLVYGRRRQGKTLMLELLAEATGGFMFTAREQAAAQNLADLSAAYARHTNQPASLRFSTWEDAVDALLGLGAAADRSVPVILDEFPYLVAQVPQLMSVLQIALSPRSRAKRSGRTRLILCGSALSVMRDLLSAGAPLRGRAKLELVLRPFWYREAAAFWNLEGHPELAFRVNALLGGTPAYQEMSFGPPTSRADFDRWVARGPLNPASALFREGNLMLREEPSITDPAPYQGVLTAVGQGATRRSEIAGRLARPATAIAHLLTGLEQVGLVARLDDAFLARRGVYRLTDPLLRLHLLVIQPSEGALIRRRAEQVWQALTDTVSAKIYGPHFEDLAREWCLSHADVDTLGGRASRVLPATLACREHQRGHEIDAVVVEVTAGLSDRVVAIGEAKSATTPLEEAQLARLEHIRTLIPHPTDAPPPTLLLFSRGGFTPGLRTAARRDVELVDLDRLYHGA